MKCECSFVIATSGVAEPFILIDGKWVDLIDLDFKCPKCNNNIKYDNSNNYPDMWEVKQ